MIRVGVTGYGHWGKVLARALASHSHFTVSSIADPSQTALELARDAYPNAMLFQKPEELIQCGGIDAIAVATPAESHYAISSLAVSRGLHALVCKPAGSLDELARLSELSKQSKSVVIVDHTYVYHPCVTKIRQLLDCNAIGQPRIVDSVRTGLGIYKTDADVISDLAIHDISILELLFGLPESISATAYSSVTGELWDNTVLTFRWREDLHAHVRASWISPLKQRLYTFVCSDKMLVWDESREDRLVTVDSGLDKLEFPESTGRAPFKYRYNGVSSVVVAKDDALSYELTDWYEAITGCREPASSLEAAMRTMSIVDACRESAKMNGSVVHLLPTPSK